MVEEIKKYDVELPLTTSHRYKTSKGEISVVEPSVFTFDNYEIYCISGGFFESTERYETLEKAEERIKELLG